MYQHPSGKVRRVRRVELQRRQVQPTLPGVRVVALEAMFFKELPAFSRQVATHQWCRGSEKQNRPDKYFHGVETSHARKACAIETPAARKVNAPAVAKLQTARGSRAYPMDLAENRLPCRRRGTPARIISQAWAQGRRCSGATPREFNASLISHLDKLGT